MPFVTNTPHWVQCAVPIFAISIPEIGDDGSVTLHNHFYNSYNAVTPFSISNFLEKHEKEFFEVVNPRQSLRKLIRKGVVTEDLMKSVERSNIDDGREILFEHLKLHASVQTLREYCKVAIDANGYPNMQSFGRKMMEELKQRGWFQLHARLHVM